MRRLSMGVLTFSAHLADGSVREYKAGDLLEGLPAEIAADLEAAGLSFDASCEPINPAPIVAP